MAAASVAQAVLQTAAHIGKEAPVPNKHAVMQIVHALASAVGALDAAYKSKIIYDLIPGSWMKAPFRMWATLDLSNVALLLETYSWRLNVLTS